MAPTPQPAGAQPQLAPSSSVAAHHSLVLRTSSLLDCQFLHQFFCLLYFRATSRSRLTTQGRVSTGIDGLYFISLIYFTLVCSFLLTSSERVSFSYCLFACEGKRECWLLVALPLALNVADCSPHQLAGLQCQHEGCSLAPAT